MLQRGPAARDVPVSNGEPVTARRKLRMMKSMVVLLALVAVVSCAHRGTSNPTANNSAPSRPAGLFATHKAVGGLWYEAALNAFVSFNRDGTISGTYYQYKLRGFWSPRTADTFTFSAFLTDPAPGVAFQWQPAMFGRVERDTLELVWPDTQKRDFLVRRQSAQ